MARRGKFYNPSSDRRRELDEAAYRRAVLERAQSVLGKSGMTPEGADLELPPEVLANELASLAVKSREAFHASLRHR
jgi:hypothetical protein